MEPGIYKLPTYKCYEEPELLFHPLRNQDRHIHPLQGLIKFGPFSRSLVNNLMDPIRLAIIAPSGYLKRVDELINELESKFQPRERKQYLPEFLGFSRLFGLRVVSGSNLVRFELDKQIEYELEKTEKPYLILSQKLSQIISGLQIKRSEFDVLVIYLPEIFKKCFKGEEGDDFDLHDYLKALSASAGIPTQILNEDRVMSYPCRASVMWRLSIAIYSKAGGVPWKLANFEEETAFIGLSYALRTGDDVKPRFVTCCSQVFDDDGAGLEFMVYETDDYHFEKENPFLSRVEMRRMITRSLNLYQKRHFGKSPKTVSIHKSTEFTFDEIEGCFDAWTGSEENLQLLQIQDSMWRGIKLDKPTIPGTKSKPAKYPCDRGTFLQLGTRSALFWTQGNASKVGRGDYFKEGKGIPHPLLIIRHAGYGGWDPLCQGILGLTKMDWNNDNLYDRLPVTVGYAKVLARVVKRIPDLAPKPYELRYFI
jgi:hypothetical protein